MGKAVDETRVQHFVTPRRMQTDLAFPDGTAWRWTHLTGWVAIGCACQSDIEDPGPTHLPECPWSDPDYPEGVPF